MDAAQPFGYQAPGTHPSRAAALAAANGAIQAGVTRSADQMESGAEDDIPPAKRQKVNKPTGSTMYSEEDWISMHPVSLLFI